MTGALEMTKMPLNEDAQFIFPCADRYWSKKLRKGGYESEIRWLLQRAAHRPYAMIDCGANYGYWSVLASSAPYGRHPCVAVEASHANYTVLGKNADANGGRFAILQRAIFDRSDDKVVLYGRKHFGLSVRSDWHPEDNDITEQVDTITVDDVADQFLPARRDPPLLKIDVEGAEIEALKGAHRLVEEGALVIYEDHGKEAAHPVSRFVLEQLDVSVWHVGPDEQPVRIETIAQVAGIKTNPIHGYNFFACRRHSSWSSLFEGTS